MVPAKILRQAEGRIRATKRDVAAMSVKDVQQLVRELQVHQIELDMQNEELRRTQAQLEVARDRYVDLYDFSPAGHLTLDTHGTIVEANLRAGTLLGINRKVLIGKLLAHSITRDDQDTFHRHYQEVLKTDTRQICEVRIRKMTAASRWVYLESLAMHDKSGRITHWRTALLDITERKRAEEAMRESEQRFHTMADTVPVLIWMSGPDKLHTYFNRGWLDYTGRTMEEEVGNGWADGVHPEDFALCLKTYGKAFDRREPFQIEYRLRKADGQYGWLHDSGVPRLLPDGTFNGYLGGCIDITDRKAVEQMLHESKTELAAELSAMNQLHTLSTGLPISSDLISLLDEVLDASIKLLKADFGNIQLYDPNTKSLKIVAQRGFKQDFLDYFECVRLGDQSACSEALQHGKRVIIEDVELCPSYAPHRTIAASAGYRAVQSTPLLSRSGDLLGILSTHYRQPHRPAGRDLRTLDMYVHQAVDWIARRRAEEALRESQERLHYALESSRAGTWRVDFQTGLDTRDANLNRLLGLPAETTTQPIEEWFTFVHPEDRPAMDTAWEQALTTGVYEGEHRLISREGVIRWVYDRGCFVRDEAGQPLYATGAAIDITERKRAEEVMRESEQRFHTMADTAPVLIWMSGLDKLCTYFNQRWLDYTGQTLEQELGNSWADGLHPEDSDQWLKRYAEAFDRREPFQMEYRLRKADGQYGWLLDHGVPRYFPNGEFAGYIGSCIDLTEQKDLENRLRKTVKEKESLLREVHHRVKNNLQVISSLLNLQAASIKDPQVVQLFRECQTRIASIALLHETLHQSNDLSCISMSDYLRTLAGHVFRSYGVDPQVIVLDLLVEDLTFDIDTGMTCGMIVEELLSNSLKHAYAEGKGGRIQIELRAQDEGAYLLQVRDAGVGISKGGGQRNPASLGLELVNLLVDKLEGTVKLQSGPGTAWRIEFHQLHYQERM